MKPKKKLLSAAVGLMLAAAVLAPCTSAEAYSYDWGKWFPGIGINDDSETLPSSSVLTSDAGANADIADAGKCASGVSWTLYADGLLVLEGSGAVDSTCSSSHQADIIRVEIKSGVTQIGTKAFNKCSNLSSVSIPESVTCIKDRVFTGCTSLSSIQLPSGLTEIGYSAFNGCTSLTEIVIPGKVTEIANSTFQSCSSLSSVSLPEGLLSIGSSAFNGCGLKTLTLPSTVKAIDNSAFYNCSSMTNISLPDGLESIGSYVFQSCKRLSDISIPENVNCICAGTFYGCSSLARVTIPRSVKVIEISAFYGCSLSDVFYLGTEAQWRGITIGLYNTSLTNASRHNVSSENEAIYISVSAATNGTVTAPGFAGKGETVTVSAVPDPGYVLQYVLVNGKQIAGTTFTANADTVVSAVFAPLFPEKDILTYQVCSSGVICVLYTDGELYLYGSGAADSSCIMGKYQQVKRIVIAGGVTAIADNAFSSCSNLLTVTVSPGVASIGSYSFYYCEKLTSVVLPDSLNSIGGYAFCGCASLTVLDLPDGMTSIGSHAFEGCSSLTGVTLPAGLTAVCDSLFSGCTNLNELTIPNSVTAIGADAFSGCENLNKLTLPAQIASIGGGAFSGCSRLEGIILPGSLRSIGDAAFADCYLLADVFFVGNTAGWGRIGLGQNNACLTEAHLHFTSSAANVVTITVQSSQFGSVTAPIFAERGSLVTVSVTPGFSSSLVAVFVNGQPIEGISFTVEGDTVVTAEFEILESNGACGKDSYWELSPAGVLHISGFGVVSQRPWPIGNDAIKQVVIGEGITGLCNSAFMGCTGLTEIYLPAGITEIPNLIFLDCSSLEIITIPENVTSIGRSAFSGCSSLETIVIPENVTSIGDNAFFGCTALTSAELPNTLTDLDKSVFSGCSGALDISYYPTPPLVSGDPTPEAPLAVDSVRLIGNTLILKTINGSGQRAAVISAFYDDAGRMIGMSYDTAAFRGGNLFAPVETRFTVNVPAQYKTVKVFILGGTDCVPLCNAPQINN